MAQPFARNKLTSALVPPPPSMLVAAACGGVAVLFLPRWPSTLEWMSLLVVLTVMWWRLPGFRLPLLGLVLQALWSLGHVQAELKHWPSPELGRIDALVNGVVTSQPRHQLLPTRSSFEFRIDTVLSADSVTPEAARSLTLHARRLRITHYSSAIEPQAGERWQLNLRIRAPSRHVNPGGFDAERWLLQQRLHGTAYVRGGQDVNHRLAQAPGNTLFRLRQRLATRLAEEGGQHASMGFVRGLTLGLPDLIDQADLERLRKTGTAHLLAISGLHVGWAAVLGGAIAHGVWWLVLIGRRRRIDKENEAPTAGRLAALNVVQRGIASRFPRLHRRIRRYTLCGSRDALVLPAALFTAMAFSLLAGLALPTRRAVVMLAVLVVAQWQRRRILARTRWWLALWIIITLSPLSPLSPGFWLSFAAIAAIFWLFEGRRGFPANGRRALRLHLGLGLAMLPLSVVFFQSAPWVAPLANALAIPLVTLLLLPLSLLCLLSSALNWDVVSQALFSACDLVRALLVQWLELCLNLPGAHVQMALPTSGLQIGAVIGTVALLAPRGLGLRRMAPLLLMPPLLFNLRPAPIEGEFEVIVLDVGQGSASLVLTERHSVLIDTGPRGMAERVVVPALHALGRRRLDILVLSHADSDHAAGAAWLSERFPDAMVWHSAPDGSQHRCAAGQGFTLDAVRFDFLGPPLGDLEGLDDNDRSCVLLVHRGQGRVLFPGDIALRAEAALAARVGLLPLTAMVTPHHGSATSSGAALLQNFRPEIALHSAARDHVWGFPDATVQMRYKLSGSRQFNTAGDGAVRLILNQGGLHAPIERWRARNRRLWHR